MLRRLPSCRPVSVACLRCTSTRGNSILPPPCSRVQQSSRPVRSDRSTQSRHVQVRRFVSGTPFGDPAVGWVVGKFLDKVSSLFIRGGGGGGPGGGPCASQSDLEAAQQSLSSDLVAAQRSLASLHNKVDNVALVQQLQALVPLVKLGVQTLVGLMREHRDLHVEEVISCHPEVAIAISKLSNLDHEGGTCRHEIESLVRRYVEFAVSVFDIIEEYDSRGRVGRWWQADSTRSRLQSSARDYQAFLQAFQCLLQADSSFAMTSEVQCIRSAIVDWSNSVERGIAREAERIQSNIDEMNANMGSNFQDVKAEMRTSQEHLNSKAENNHAMLSQGIDFLARQSVNILENQRQTGQIISQMLDVQREQNQFIAEQGKFIMSQVSGQTDLIQRQQGLIEQLLSEQASRQAASNHKQRLA